MRGQKEVSVKGPMSSVCHQEGKGHVEREGPQVRGKIVLYL